MKKQFCMSSFVISSSSLKNNMKKFNSGFSRNVINSINFLAGAGRDNNFLDRSNFWFLTIDINSGTVIHNYSALLISLDWLLGTDLGKCPFPFFQLKVCYLLREDWLVTISTGMPLFLSLQANMSTATVIIMCNTETLFCYSFIIFWQKRNVKRVALAF